MSVTAFATMGGAAYRSEYEG